jgi:hypothetical protein
MASVIVRSKDSASFPLCDGGIPRWSSINLQVDNHFLEFCAIGLAHLVLHERAGDHHSILRSLECSADLACPGPAKPQRTSPRSQCLRRYPASSRRIPASRTLPYERNNEGDLVCVAISLAHEEETQPSRQSQARTSGPSERNSPSMDRGHTCSLFEGCSLAAESSIRRYRFGSCRCKQQAMRDECGKAWLDTEPDEMVRSRRGTVA